MILVAWQLLMFWLIAGAAVVVEGQPVSYLGRSAFDESAVWEPIPEVWFCERYFVS